MTQRYYGRLKSTKKFDKQHKYSAIPLPNIIDLSQYRPKIVNQLQVGRCYDDKTEVLTKKGWQFWKNINIDEEILCYEPKTKVLEYHKPSRLFAYDYNGEMVKIKGKSIDMLVTPDHNMLVYSWDESKRKVSNASSFTKANELGWYFNIPCTGKWLGQEQESFHLNGCKTGPYRTPNTLKNGTSAIVKEGYGFHKGVDIETDKWADFLGIYLAEGYASPQHDYEVGIAAVKTGKRERVEELVGELPFHYGSSWDRFRIYNKTLCQELEPLGEAREKHCPDFIKSLPALQIKKFLNAFGIGDGHWNTNTQTWTFYTSSKQLADDLQELIIKSGAWAQILYRTRNGMIKGKVKPASAEYCLRMTYRDHMSIDCKQMVSRVPYHGMVYCAEVATHAMVVRRNGKPIISGNCSGCGIGGATSGKLSQLGLNPSNDFIVSPDDLYNGARVLEGTLNADDGAEAVDVYDWLKKYGYIPYNLWPISAKLSTVNPATLENEAIQLPNFVSVGLDTSVDGALANLLDALAAGNFMTVGADYFSAWENYKGGMQPVIQSNGQIAGGHEEYFYYADNTQRYLKRANSWGTTDFGQNNPGIDKGCEYISFDEIPILAGMGMDLHYASFSAPSPAPQPQPKKKCKVLSFLSARKESHGQNKAPSK